MKNITIWLLSALIGFVFLIFLSFPVVAPPSDHPGEPKSLDDLFLDVGEKAPGFGGMFIDGDVLKVYVANKAQKPDAEAAIASIFGRERIPRGGIEVLQGQYSFAQLKKWHDRMGGLFDIQGVIFADIDEKENRVKVGVETPDSIEVIEQKLIEQGIPRDAFVIEQAEPIVPVATLRDYIRPLQGGIQIRFSGYLCTLGFNGIRSGNNGFVVASHCTDKQGAVEGTKYYQPLYATPDYFIGTEIADPTYTPCYSGSVCRYSDSAFGHLASGVTQRVGLIERPNSMNTGSLTIAGSFRIVSEGRSFIGQKVNKVGRTTGWTQGPVTKTCVNTGVYGTNIVLLCQDFVNANVGGGDSGSPVFRITNSPRQNDVQLRGILWGGNLAGTQFVYSPIANVQRSTELGSIATCAPGFSC